MTVSNASADSQLLGAVTAQDIVAQSESEAGVSPGLHEAGAEKLGNTAQRSFLRLSAACYFVGQEIAQRHTSHLRGLSGVFSDRLLMVVNGQRSGALGTFSPKKWAFDAQPFDEIHVNIGHEIYAGADTPTIAADVVLTICHELVHLYARANNISDTSGRGNRYHNSRFATLARRLELRVERSGRSHIGFQTTGFTEQGLALYADLIEVVERELQLLPNTVPSAKREPQATPEPVAEVAVRKYVFAQCECRNEQGRKRTFRMARGWWQDGTIGCAICQQIFTESPPEWTRTAGAS